MGYISTGAHYSRIRESRRGDEIVVTAERRIGTVRSTPISITTPGPIVATVFGAPSYLNLAFQNILKQCAAFGKASYEFGPFRATAEIPMAEQCDDGTCDSNSEGRQSVGRIGLEAT